MRVDVLGEAYIYQNPSPAARSRQGFFPGVCRLDNGELLALFMMGEAFEAANCRPHRARSVDGGATWVHEGPLLPAPEQAFAPNFSDCYKPTIAADGTVVAAGYGFVRDDPELSLSDAIAAGSLPPCHNVLTRSADGGRTWSRPVPLGTSVDGLELSGPLLRMASGRLLATAPRFAPNPDVPQEGLTFASDDGGRTWTRLGDFFDRPGVTAWETRCVETAPGRLALLLWAYDLRAERHLDNQFVASDDGGATWRAPVATGVMGQASGLCPAQGTDGERLLTLHAHRAGDDPGLFLRDVDVGGGGFAVRDTFALWRPALPRVTDGSIDRQFAALSFGQPNLLPLGGDEYLAYFWCQESILYVVKCFRLRVRLS